MLKRFFWITYFFCIVIAGIPSSSEMAVAEDYVYSETTSQPPNPDPSSSKEDKKELATIDINTFIEEKSEADLDLFDKDKSQKAKNKIEMLLKVEPGDGLLKLNWQLVGFPQNVDLQEQIYVISYGVESGKLKKNINVGKGTSYILRDLKNHQVYFIQISTTFKLTSEDAGSVSKNTLLGTQDEKKVSLKSEEIKATPLPDDEFGGSALEKSYSKKTVTLLDKYEADPFNRDLRQFGYEFFKNSAQLSGSMDNIPVGNNFILGPGDTLSITLWGSLNARHELSIDRNGEIMIPKVGPVKVWGMPLDQAKEVVTKAISQYYKNFQINITLGKLRSIQIFVVGEVEFPGSYPVSSLATVVNAISAAGGPTKNGSLRAIKVSNTGKPAVDIDLYNILLNGDRNNDIRLQNGDTIFVPVIGHVVAVAGEVKRPAIYETKGDTTLTDVIAMAGGVTANGDLSRVQIERFSSNNAKIIIDHNFKDSIESASKINDRDMIKVFPVQEAIRQVITLKGNVMRPGEYQYRKGMRLLDVIPDFNALLPESYFDSAEITRLAFPDYHKEVLTFNLRNALNGNESDNILLQEQDTIMVYSSADMQEKMTVTINGEVVNPGIYNYFPGMTVRDLVAAAGSPKRNALLEQTELSRVTLDNEKATSSHINISLGKALEGDPENNLVLQPDDSLSVRSITDWLDATDKFVTLKGEVMYPGVYAISRGEKLSSIIERAGGYTAKAYLAGAKFTRKSVKEVQQKRMDEIINRTEKEIYQKMAALSSTATSKEEVDATRSALEGLLKQLEILKRSKAEGRVVIKISALDKLAKSSYNMALEGGDSLEIPARPSVVHVMGQVYNPTSFVHTPENSAVSAYLNKAGGATRDGEESDMYIIKADGTVFSKQQSSFGLKWNDDSRSWSFGSFNATHMLPGDTLVMPQKLERTAWIREIKDITTIISQIALTAGTVLIGLR